jgi:hypothetical protein
VVDKPASEEGEDDDDELAAELRRLQLKFPDVAGEAA